MTVTECVERVDAALDNPYDEETKARWVMDVEGRLLRRLEGYEETPPQGPEHWPEDADTPLRASGPYEALYEHYLEAMICYHLQDTEPYNYAMAEYNTMAQDFLQDYHRTKKKKNPGSWRGVWG